MSPKSKLVAGKWLAHQIVTPGRTFRPATITIAADGTYTVEPYRGETHSTRFFNGTVIVTDTGEITFVESACCN